jgi:hypothetical protein
MEEKQRGVFVAFPSHIIWACPTYGGSGYPLQGLGRSFLYSMIKTSFLWIIFIMLLRIS